VNGKRRVQPAVLAVIAVGGALGTLARYEIAQLIKVQPGAFPWATFWTNVSGAFVLGFFLTFFIERFPPSRYPRAFFAVGFLGAYTTFSTMAVETVTLIKDGHAAVGVSYILVSIAIGVLVASAGVALGHAANS
jgi:fluoride exporter